MNMPFVAPLEYPNGYTPPPQATGLPDGMRRGLGAAILKARHGCCPSCDFLANLRSFLGDQMEVAAEPPGAAPPAAAGVGAASPESAP